MGYIDQTHTKVSCEKCGETELQKVLQYGSLSSASWGDYGSFVKFEVTIKRDADEPVVSGAKCKKCKTAAKIETGYNLE